MIWFLYGSRDGSVGIETRLRAGWSGDRNPAGALQFFFLQKLSERLCAQNSLLFIGYRFSQGVKRVEIKPDHSPLSTAGVKKGWNYTSTPPYALMA